MQYDYIGDCEFTKLYTSLTRLYWTRDEKGASINVGVLLNEFRKHFPRFVEFQQHDAQEAMLCIIDILERSVPIIKQWFYGKKVQETIWPDGKSTREEEFGMHILCSNGQSLENMLKESIKWNTLTDFVDDNDVTHRIATTRMIFHKLPKILIISFDKKSHIEISENVFIGNYAYTLIASSVHIGIQSDGHYVCFTKHKDIWHYKNDDFVREDTLPTRAGHYILVYNLRNPSS
jgi:hypothetical protein